MQEQLVIVWRVYEPCNLACGFCEYNREIIRKRHIVNSDEILRFGKILSEFQQHTNKEVLVSWLGGEPTLWKDFISISNQYHKDFGVQLGVTTNGTMLHREFIRNTLIENYSNTTISIDGFADFHDNQRGEQGLFEKVKYWADVLTRDIEFTNSKLRLRVNTVLMRKNIADFEAFCMEIAAWGIKELTFNQLGGEDTAGFYSANRLLPEQVLWLKDELPAIQRNALEKGLKVFGTSKYLERIMATSNGMAIPVDDCNPGRQFLFINEQNLASPCHFTTKNYGLPISQIETVDDLIKLPEKFRARKLVERAMPCMDCHSTQVFEKFGFQEIEENIHVHF